MKPPAVPPSPSHGVPDLQVSVWWHFWLLLLAPVSIYLTVIITFTQWQLTTWYALDLRSQNVVDYAAEPVPPSFSPLEPALLEELAAERRVVVLAPVTQNASGTAVRDFQTPPPTAAPVLSDVVTPTPTTSPPPQTATPLPSPLPETTDIPDATDLPEETPTATADAPTLSTASPAATQLLPTATVPLPTLTLPVPTATLPVPTATISLPTVTPPPVPTATLPPLPTVTLPPLPTATIPLPTATIPLPTVALP